MNIPIFVLIVMTNVLRGHGLNFKIDIACKRTVRCSSLLNHNCDTVLVIPRSKSTVGSLLVSAIISEVARGLRLNAPRTNTTLKAYEVLLS